MISWSLDSETAVEMALRWALLCLICSPLVLASDYGLPKFICSPMPLDMEHGCQSASQQRHGPGANNGANGHWVGTLEEAKETILHLRETVVHQKEMILDQRETVRELTAKLSRCEAHSRRHIGEHHGVHHEVNHSHGHHEGGHQTHHEGGHQTHHEGGHQTHHEGGHQTHHEGGHRAHHEGGHHEDAHRLHHEDAHRDLHKGIHARENEYHHFGQREHHEHQLGHNTHDAFRKGATAVNTMEDPPKETTTGVHQMERMLESLKERLEHLQHNRNSSLFSASLRDALQKKISMLEHQIHAKSNSSDHHERGGSTAAGLRQGHVSHGSDAEKGHKVEKRSEDFRVGFPLRTNYMYAKVKRTLHHEIFAFSICLWLKSSSAPGMGTPFSYSVPGQANEVVLIEWGNNPMELLINDKAATLPLSINDAKWHHICVTWSTRDGIWETYQDGVRRGSGENLAPWHPVKAGGVFVLGQEQDTLGGRFDATQAFIGEISDFNMWGHILTAGEVYKMATCTSDIGGDLINWAEASVELHGGVVKLPFNACH
ncbi:PREDICTED: neuronal pentraxin-1-like [Gekko japonicus]|uniref:Neuronal pentraxin-1-like n=1 Tax=Gekko japonicus TaxID=146911 RepID=A0ABM1K846_GEKJA|nr:PREDICTED: neuronal pentraxin-1-like [Gekko japonicus]